MCKSSSLIFVLLFAFLFGLERPRWVLLVIILVISLGVALMVANEADFVLIGYLVLVMAGSSR
jgi:solute carrier family 35 protein C2